jgi:hypothetical protein
MINVVIDPMTYYPYRAVCDCEWESDNYEWLSDVVTEMVVHKQVHAQNRKEVRHVQVQG